MNSAISLANAGVDSRKLRANFPSYSASPQPSACGPVLPPRSTKPVNENTMSVGTLHSIPSSSHMRDPSYPRGAPDGYCLKSTAEPVPMPVFGPKEVSDAAKQACLALVILVAAGCGGSGGRADGGGGAAAAMAAGTPASAPSTCSPGDRAGGTGVDRRGARRPGHAEPGHAHLPGRRCLHCSAPVRRARTEEGATGDRWCAFVAASPTTVNAADLFVFNATKAAAGTAITCGAATETNCLKLTAAFAEDDGAHGAFFQGDTLVYLRRDGDAVRLAARHDRGARAGRRGRDDG